MSDSLCVKKQSNVPMLKVSQSYSLFGILLLLLLLCSAWSVLSSSDWTRLTDNMLRRRCHTAHYCSVHCLEKDTKAHNLSGECLLMQANQSRYN